MPARGLLTEILKRLAESMGEVPNAGSPALAAGMSAGMGGAPPASAPPRPSMQPTGSMPPPTPAQGIGGGGIRNYKGRTGSGPMGILSDMLIGGAFSSPADQSMNRYRDVQTQQAQQEMAAAQQAQQQQEQARRTAMGELEGSGGLPLPSMTPGYGEGMLYNKSIPQPTRALMRGMKDVDPMKALEMGAGALAPKAPIKMGEDTLLSGDDLTPLWQAPEQPRAPTTAGGMVWNPDTRKFEPIPGYVEMASRIAAAGRAPTATTGPAAPSGYRPTADGKLEFIPGGPADPAVALRGPVNANVDQARNSQLYSRAKEQLPIALEHWDALGSVQGGMSGIPGVGNFLAGESYQRAIGSVRDIAASYLYSVSGATATPSEIQGTVERVMPRVTDTAKTKADKRQRLTEMVESIKTRAGPAYDGGQQPQAAPQAQSAPSGQPKRITTDAEYDALRSGETFIGPDGKPRRKP
jgi:hypothetical protein